MECTLSPSERRELAIQHWRVEVEQMDKWAQSALDEYLLAVKRGKRAKEMLARLQERGL